MKIHIYVRRFITNPNLIRLSLTVQIIMLLGIYQSTITVIFLTINYKNTYNQFRLNIFKIYFHETNTFKNLQNKLIVKKPQ